MHPTTFIRLVTQKETRLSPEFAQAFLSNELQYSCPIWSEEEDGVRGDLDTSRPPDDLERAQARKINYMLNKARLKPGHRLLEIGTGWGSLAITVRVEF
jgi:cyclopropane-fatty-acyl-phospholipid synthase